MQIQDIFKFRKSFGLTLKKKQQQKEHRVRQAEKQLKEEKTDSRDEKDSREEINPIVEQLKGRGHMIIHSPQITEKSTALKDQGKYIFRVFPRATVRSVREAIEEIYKVRVTRVHMVKVRPKRVRRGRFEGERMRYSKAIITVKKGESIEIIPQ